MRKSPSKGPLRHIFQENFDHRRPVKVTFRPETVASQSAVQRLQFQKFSSPLRPGNARLAGKRPVDTHGRDKGLKETEAASEETRDRKVQSALKGLERSSQSASPLRFLEDQKMDGDDKNTASVDLTTFRKLPTGGDASPDPYSSKHLRVRYDLAPLDPSSEVTPSFRACNRTAETCDTATMAEVPRLRDMYRKILREHQSLKAKVENQQMWIRKLVSQSEGRTGAAGEEQTVGRILGVKAAVHHKSQRRALSSAADVLVSSIRPTPKPQNYSLCLLDSPAPEDPETIRYTMPSSSTPSPTNGKLVDRLDSRGDSMFIYPSSKGESEGRLPGLRQHLTEDNRRRGTSVPRQRQEGVGGARFPKEVFPMNVRRRPAQR